METLKQIVHEIVFGSRKTKINLIKELAGDEYENTESVFELASKTEEQINITLSSIFDYYFNEIND